jgi:hypothetical protein
VSICLSFVAGSVGLTCSTPYTLRWVTSLSFVDAQIFMGKDHLPGFLVLFQDTGLVLGTSVSLGQPGGQGFLVQLQSFFRESEASLVLTGACETHGAPSSELLVPTLHR